MNCSANVTTVIQVITLMIFSERKKFIETNSKAQDGLGLKYD